MCEIFKYIITLLPREHPENITEQELVSPSFSGNEGSFMQFNFA